MNIFDLFAKINLDSSGFNRGVKEAESKMNVLATNVSKLGNNFTSMGNVTQKIGQGMVSVGKKASAVTAAVSGIFTGAFAKAKSYIKTYESAMVVFKNSSNVGEQAANSLFKTLVNIAQNSSYAREHLIEAGKTLVAFGFDADKTAKYVQTITNAVAKMGWSGSEIERLAELFGKMSNQTKVYTTDLNTMVNSGIRAWDILAAHYNTTTDAVQDMAKEGKLLATDTLQILNDALNETNENSKMFEFSIAGMAKALKSGTLAGTLDSLNSSFRTFSINLLGMDPTTKEGRESIMTLNGALSAFGKTMETLGTRFGFVGDWLKSALEKVTATLEKFTSMLEGAPEDKLKSIAKAVLAVAAAGPGLTGLGKGVEMVGKSFSGLGKIVDVAGKGLDKAFSGLGDFANSFGKLGFSAFNAVKSMGSAFGGGLDKIFNFAGLGQKIQSGLLGNLAAVNMKISPMVDGIKNKFSELGEKIPAPLQKIGSGIQATFGGIGQKVMPALQQFGGGILQFGSELLPKVLGAFNFAAMGGAIIAGLGLLQENFGDKITEFANMAMEKGPELITNFINGITSKLPELMQKGTELLQTVLNVITTNLPTILQGAASIIMTLAQGFSQNLPQILDSTLDIILMIVDTIIDNLPMIIKIGMDVLSNLIKGIAKKMPDIIRAAIDLVFTLVDALLDNIDELIDAGIDLCMALADGLIDALPKLIDKIPVIIDKLIDAIVNNLPKIIDAGITIIIKLTEGIWKQVPHLVSKIPGIITKIVDGLGKLGGKLWDVGKHAIEELWNGIKSMAGWLGDQIGGFCNNVVGGFKSFFGIQSPSSVFRDMIGKNLALGIGEGFEETIGGVENAMIKSFNVGKVQDRLFNKINKLTSGNLNYGNVSFGASIRGLEGLNMMNSLNSAIGSGRNSSINVYIGGKKIASEVYDPLMDLMHNKEVRVGV